MADPGPTVPVATLAKLFDLTERRVQQLAKDGIIPKAARGQYPLIESVRGYVRYLQKIVAGEASVTTRDDLRTEQLRRLKIENDARARETLDRQEVRAGFSEALIKIRTGALALPGRITPRVAHLTDHRQINELIHSDVVQFLDDAAEELGRFGVDPGPVPDPPRAGKKKPRRVGKRKKKAPARKRRGRKV